MRIAIIGAGMAGLSAAHALGAGHDIALFDKGRGPGGRMSTRRAPSDLGELRFDHGAPWFEARGAFAETCRGWHAAGVICHAEMRADRWTGTPAMNAAIKAMAKGFTVEWGVRIAELVGDAGAARWSLRTEADEERGPFDAVVIAVPSEQAADLLAPCHARFAGAARRCPSDPAWVAMYGFANAADLPDFTSLEAISGRAIRNSAKSGRDDAECWTVEAGAEWSRAHLEAERDEVAELLLTAFREAGLSLDPVHRAAHRWRFARPNVAERLGRLWDADTAIGVCGDWTTAPTVGGAWASGKQLAAEIEGFKS